MPKEPEMIEIVENVWEQIEKHNIIKGDQISKVRAQTALKFNLDINPLRAKFIKWSNTLKSSANCRRFV